MQNCGCVDNSIIFDYTPWHRLKLPESCSADQQNGIEYTNKHLWTYSMRQFNWIKLPVCMRHLKIVHILLPLCNKFSIAPDHFSVRNFPFSINKNALLGAILFPFYYFRAKKSTLCCAIRSSIMHGEIDVVWVASQDSLWASWTQPGQKQQRKLVASIIN